MSAALNSKIDNRSSSVSADSHGLELIAGDESGTPDPFPAISSKPCAPADAELDRLSIFEFSAAEIFQHSPLGDVLNSLRNLSLAGDSQQNYVRFELGAMMKENFTPHPPPTS